MIVLIFLPGSESRLSPGALARWGRGSLGAQDPRSPSLSTGDPQISDPGGDLRLCAREQRAEARVQVVRADYHPRRLTLRGRRVPPPRILQGLSRSLLILAERRLQEDEKTQHRMRRRMTCMREIIAAPGEHAVSQTGSGESPPQGRASWHLPVPPRWPRPHPIQLRLTLDIQSID